MLIDEMANSVEYWLKANYRAAPPLLAQDASPYRAAQRTFRELVKRWLKRFDEAAPTVAETYLKNAFRGSDTAMRMALKDAGWTVKFTMTPAMRDAFDACLAENVGLIKSIPQQYLLQVEGIVSRSYTAGRDLPAMVKALQALYPKTADRAYLIARDQSNKANATVARTRQLELGITEFQWLHSHAGKEPRSTHVAMNGKRFPVSQGAWDSKEGAYVFPGELINCRCSSRPILPHMTA
jgi:SPP1 gp7 family putative phage head morphogenesis protein